MGEKWITEEEVAKLIDRAVQTLRNDRCKCQGLAYYKMGRQVRYKLSDVLAYMEQNKIVPNSH